MMVPQCRHSPIFLIESSVSLETLTSKFWRMLMLFCGIFFSSPALFFLQTVFFWFILMSFLSSLKVPSLVQVISFYLPSQHNDLQPLPLCFAPSYQPRVAFPMPLLTKYFPLTTYSFSSHLDFFLFLVFNTNHHSLPNSLKSELSFFQIQWIFIRPMIYLLTKLVIPPIFSISEPGTTVI